MNAIKSSSFIALNWNWQTHQLRQSKPSITKGESSNENYALQTAYLEVIRFLYDHAESFQHQTTDLVLENAKQTVRAVG